MRTERGLLNANRGAYFNVNLKSGFTASSSGDCVSYLLFPAHEHLFVPLRSGSFCSRNFWGSLIIKTFISANETCEIKLQKYLIKRIQQSALDLYFLAQKSSSKMLFN